MWTGCKLLQDGGDEKVQPDKNLLVRLGRRFLPLTGEYYGTRFWIQQKGSWLGTPLVLVLLAIGTTDLVFAVDSIPAILAITRDPFVVLTSNAFAVLGLRSLYFAIAGLIKLFRYLNIGLAVVLVFIGLKMIASPWIHTPHPPPAPSSSHSRPSPSP